MTLLWNGQRHFDCPAAVVSPQTCTEWNWCQDLSGCPIDNGFSQWRVPRNSMESATLSRRANDVDGCKAADNYITLLSKGDV
mmetsp:Transcript_30572/g.63075  ORF Transcript_30572/g.63075 Transcript_30572/m.63075 type:complete len:82 (-) Transcript_30572:26-271(-)